MKINNNKRKEMWDFGKQLKKELNDITSIVQNEIELSEDMIGEFNKSVKTFLKNTKTFKEIVNDNLEN